MGNSPVLETNDLTDGALLDWFAGNLQKTMAQHGHRLSCTMNQDEELTGQENVVLHAVDPQSPRAYRRKSRAIFVIGTVALKSPVDNVLKFGYPLLVRSLSNHFILLEPSDDHERGPRAHFITLERGHYTLASNGDDTAFFEEAMRRIVPLATSQLIIDNEFTPDLSEELWEGDEYTESIYRAGRRLDALGLLPAVFPINDLLSPRDLRHVKQLYGIGGLSYGNLSARKDQKSFWMSASGVDKSNLQTVGRDILLVTGYSPERRSIQLSVPANCQPRRVSVDAIEHLMIYREHPGAGAILHVHAWMDGITSTEVNYPCGTLELAQAVADLVCKAPDPDHAVIGLRNHGLTITGSNLDEIFSRIEGRILLQVPMS